MKIEATLPRATSYVRSMPGYQMFLSPDDDGGGNGDDAATKAKAEADRLEAEKVAAEKAAAEAEDKGGSGKPTDAEAKLLKDVMKKKAALEESNKALEDARAALKEFEGIDPVAIKKLMKERADAEEAQALARGDFDRVKAQMVEQHNVQIAVKDEEIARERTAKQSLQDQIAELTVGNAFTSSQLITGELTYTPSKMRKLFGDQFEYDATAGKVVGYDKPAGAANRTVLVDAKGEPLSFADALKKMIDTDPDKDSFYKSKVVVGTGSRTQTRKTPADVDKGASGQEKIKAGLAALKAAG